MTDDQPAFRSGAVRPVECLRAGWRLIHDDYWLFLGISWVGVLIARLAPMEILAGPMMCGIYLCLMRKEDGRRIKFETLFQGFDVFVQSLIATLLMLIPIVVIAIPAYLVFLAVFFVQMTRGGGQLPPDALYTVFATMGALYFVLFLVSVVTTALFLFVYPLIVDRKMTGVQAVKTSVRAARANFAGTLGLVLLQVLVSLLGLLVCCVGSLLEIPVYFASVLVAYRAVFPREGEESLDVPPGEGANLDPIG